VGALWHGVPGAGGVLLPGGLERLGLEAAHAFRSVRRRPGSSLATVATLGLGIGVVATAFSIVWGTVLRGLPFAEADRLVHFERARPADGQYSMAVTPHDWAAWSERQGSFEGLGAYVERAMLMPNEGRPPDRFTGVAISANSFPLLRAEAALGRTFTADDDRPGGPPVVLLSHALWSDRFGADPTLVGRTLPLDGRPTTVVGVMPEGFGFPISEAFWVPLRTDLSSVERGQGRLDVFGRLLPGVDIERARAEFDGITAALAADFPETNAGISASLRTFTEEYIGPDFARTVFALLFGAGLVLVVCCANAANLLLIQGFGRRHALGLRLALGATRGAIVRQLALESLVLAGAASAVGVAIAAYGVAWFDRVGARAGVFDLPHGPDALFWWEVGLNGPTAAAVVAAAALSALVAGLLPAFGIARASSLSSRGSVGESRGSSRLQGAVVVGQMALTAGLLVCAGLTARSVANASAASTRFDANGVLVARLSLPVQGLAGQGYEDHDARLRFLDGLVERLAAAPGVAGAALTTTEPLGRPRSGPVRVDGSTVDADAPEAGIVAASAAYFDAFGVTAVEGRVFDAADDVSGAPVALVNRSFASRHLAGRSSAVGARIRLEGDAGQPWREVVGVVPDLWEVPGSPEREAGVYVPTSQTAMGDPRTALGPWGLAYPTVVVRARPGATVDAGLVRNAVYAMDPGLPTGSVRTMDEIVDGRMARYRVWGRFSAAAAASALLLAALGTYAVLSFTVARRSAEIGIRRALGASAASVQAGVLRAGVVRVGLGLAAGLWLGWLLADGLRQVLYGVEPNDPMVFATVAVVLGVVGLAASWLPARRAARIDPRTAIGGS